MANQSRDLTIAVGWKDDALDRGTRRSAASVRQLGRELDRSQRQIELTNKRIADDEKKLQQEIVNRHKKQLAAMNDVGQTVAGIGVGILAASGAAVKAAIDWESAWTGVTKTVEGTPEQMAALEGSLRDLAKTLPASHQEIAAVAEAAGQLGIKRDAIAGFTKTMIDLGNTTNLTAEEAATSIAQIANIMGTSQKDVDRFGSALVALGNDGASTEAEILEMTKRLAGAGQLIGASETDVLALANAMASIGISAEAGGGSMSRVMQKIYVAVQEGEGAVSGFAKVAGMSASQFSEAFRKDPVAAINAFIVGLNNVEKQGGNVVGVLQQLGIRSSEDLRTVLGLKGATDLLSESLKTGSEAWKTNSALTDEANKRYETAAAQIEMAWNKIKDAAITVGGAIAPVIAGVADSVGALVDWFSKLPAPVQQAVGVLGSLVGIASLIGGGMLLLIPRLVETKNALADLGFSMEGVGRRTGRFVSAMSKAGAAASALAFAAAGMEALFGREMGYDMEAMTLGLERWAKQNQVSGEAARFLGENARDLAADLEQVSSWSNFLAGPAQDIMGFFSFGQYEGSIDASATRIAKLGDALGQLVKDGKPKVAADAFERIAKMANEAGISTDELRGMMPGYSAAVEVAGAKTKEAGDKIGQAGAQAQQTNPALESLARHFGLAGDEAEKAAQDMLEEWGQAFAEFAPLVGAYEQALEQKRTAEEEAAQATAASLGKEEGGATKSWKDFVGEVKLTAGEYIAQLEQMVANQEQWASNMVNLAGRIPPAMLDELARMGPEGADMVALLNEMTGQELQRTVELWRQSGRAAGDQFAGRLKDADPVLRAIADKLGQGVANKIREGMAKRGTTVFEEARRQGIRIDQGVDVNRPRIVRVRADTSSAETTISNAVRRMDNRLRGLEDTTVNVRAQFTYAGFRIPKHQSDTGYATGGPIRGPGGPKDDLVPIWASNGEFMQPTDAVNYYGVGFMEAIRRKQLPRGWDGSAMPGFAEGGRITGTPTVFYKGSQRGVEGKINLAAFGPLVWRDFMNSGMGGGMNSGPPPSGGWGGGVERWRSVALAALAYTGSPASWIGSLLRRMNQESGGNQFAINNWDINAARGTPSKGLMQTIDPTFYAYARELAHRGPYDPFANIVASIRYANARYGSAPVGWNRAGGYDEGGIATGAGLLAKKVIAPERVLSPRQTESFEQLVRVLDTKRGLPASPAASTTRATGEAIGAAVTQAVGKALGGLRVSGELVERNGSIVGLVRNVVVQEMDDELAFRRR
ncbi:phage tail tape measure protein [Prauserella endophytica]|uniref:Phage tail tape measure protein n=1 Tax=Prauserella endophytica TaxID=1592324 RepID=A0ABY2RSV1_9PSEU|nr:phage tail tape measure protein [Prauserella endophytica]TKG58901.1 phage tail tape measure protein [Prauserella endophytica]